MKKISSQIGLGLVCVILGFMITFQFKVNYSSKNQISTRQISDLSNEIETLKKSKEDLTLKVQEYEAKVDEYEKAAADVDATAGKMKEELESLRKLSGLTNVEGPGIIITLTPPSGELDPAYEGLDYRSLIDIVNESNSAYAEAISINEERYTSRTQVRLAGMVIKINDTSFNPIKPFEIKVIGDPDLLAGAFDMPGNILEYIRTTTGWNVDIKKVETVKILKYTKSLDYKYIK